MTSHEILGLPGIHCLNHVVGLVHVVQSQSHYKGDNEMAALHSEKRTIYCYDIFVK